MKFLAAMLMATLFAVLPLAQTSAQTQADPADAPVLTAEHARDAFARDGFEVDAITNWGWSVPTLRTFKVRETASERVLMVLVFPTSQDAGLLRGQLALHEESTTPDPYVVAGYGPGVWSGNVALVQSTESQLALVAQLQADQDDGQSPDPAVVEAARAPDIAVDVDFQEALTKSVTNL